MRRIALEAFVCLAIIGGSGSAWAASWSDAWLTRDQQAQRLLDSHHPAAAAPLFTDARRRAYAQLRAGQYAKAADLLAPYKDADSLYNRGNALARTGKLREALQSYDKALAASPGNRDMIRNRDLVKRALEQRSGTAQQQNGGTAGKQGAKNGSGNGQGGGQGGGSSGNQGGQAPGAQNGHDQGSSNPNMQARSQSQSGNPSQPGAQQSSSQQRPGQQSAQANNPSGSGNTSQQDSQSSQHGAQQSAGQEAQARNQSGTGSSQAGNTSPGAQQPAGGQAQSQSPGSSSANLTQNRGGQAQNTDQSPPGAAESGNLSTATGPTSAVNADTARQDAAAAMRYRQSQQGRDATDKSATAQNSVGVATPEGERTEANTPPSQPRTEQALALDQWLRGIPEDSGELLRRKFLIEHMMRQQGDAQ